LGKLDLGDGWGNVPVYRTSDREEYFDWLIRGEEADKGKEVL